MTAFNLNKCRLWVAALALVMGLGVCPVVHAQAPATGISAAGTNLIAGKTPAAPAKKTSSNKVGPGEKININTASVAELSRLPGIGKSKAQAIVDYRMKNGNFKSLADIEKVKGIKAALFEKLKDHIELSD